jgi:hypothetical protein
MHPIRGDLARGRPDVLATVNASTSNCAAAACLPSIKPDQADNCRMGSTPLYLNVPYDDREQAKEAGAWWDQSRKQWFIPPGRPVNHYLMEDAWIPIEVCAPDQGVQVTVLGLALNCWRCGVSTTAIVGLEPDGGDGVATAEAGFNLKIACALLGQPLPAGVGAVRMRHSGTARSSYLSNGCRSCDALLGGFPLGDAFHEAAVNDRLGIEALGRGALHPAVLDAAFERGWMGI